MFNNSKKDRKKLLIRRKSINMKGINFSNFPLIGTDKASVINNENLSNI